ncbi:DNA replication/repair protein RecF [Isobaculum melis]|uniref:DNA replication and repair protein RecF n=1 Tax=Isobaculum melis TaxID=142588 RepID=A0A1H9UKH7_9LACT|nr:DNA replication/repair protein RecF [Isobaculum melis]SES09637.1 DNA replication and repair protein RecF [Isobaculum melis]
MYLEKMSLLDYRNYATCDVEFSKGVNVFLGENAQGKTNLMEAIYVLAMTRSHRTSNDKELIAWHKEFAKISGRVQKKNTQFPLEILLSSKGKKAKLNHLEQRKLSEYVGHLNVILFAPEDLAIVKGSPSVRRRFIDMEIGQISPIYLHHLANYQHVLKQRNHYLKQLMIGKRDDHTFLEVLTEQLSTHGAHLLKERMSFVKQLEKWAAPIHHEITQAKEVLKISYQPSVEATNWEDVDQIFLDLMTQFEKGKKRELDQGNTLYGPHRDDLLFFVNEQNVQTYGSQGQQRTTALSIKLAEIELIHDEVGEYPILLLDDVLSELDDERQTHLLTAIQDKVQTFLTTTSLDGIKKHVLRQPRTFIVTNGCVELEDK